MAKVRELKDLKELDESFKAAGDKIVAICYHNGCPTAEKGWDLIAPQYPNVDFYKVNTLNSDDIKNKYADGASKPYFKFYKTGNFVNEVKYMQQWSS